MCILLIHASLTGNMRKYKIIIYNQMRPNALFRNIMLMFTIKYTFHFNKLLIFMISKKL